MDWSPGNVQKWLLWTEHQYRLPPVGKAFQELGGKELCAMSEEQFRQRSPLGGDVLHAHLDIWKSGRTWCGWKQPLPDSKLWSLGDHQPDPSQPWPGPQNLEQSTWDVRRWKLDYEAVRPHS